MGDHVPIAKKAESEVGAFVSLWRRKRWLAILLIIGGLLFAASTLYTFRAASRVAELEKEVTTLSTSLREANRENRGLREIVAPLLARAAKEFPGEEINKSLKKLVERMEADRVGNRALVSANITVDVVVDSDAKLDTTFMDRGGYAALVEGTEPLLVAASTQSTANTISENQVRFRGVFQMPADFKNVGNHLKALNQTGYIQMEFVKMDEDQKILRGKVVVVLNGNVRMEFDIPAQTSHGRKFFVRDVGAVFKTLIE